MPRRSAGTSCPRRALVPRTTRKPASSPRRRAMSRRARERTVIIERGGSSLWWFLAGGALGAGLALLFAPQSGDRTRRVVGRKIGKLRDAAEETLDELREAWSPEEEEQRVHRSLAETEDEGDRKSVG